MAGAYDDRDGFIWMDGKLVPWRDANVHVLTHALHYASSVFEGERCYGGKIFKSREHSERLLESGGCWTWRSPGRSIRSKRPRPVLKANGWTDAYVRAVAWRGAGEDMGVPPRATRCGWRSRPGNGAPITATPRWQGAKLDIAKWKRPSPETIPTAAKAAGFT
jgi:branched-chain amino acid aminotransferase